MKICWGQLNTILRIKDILQIFSDDINLQLEFNFIILVRKPCFA